MMSGNRKDLLLGAKYDIKNCFSEKPYWHEELTLVDIEKDWGVVTYKFVGSQAGIQIELIIDGETLFLFHPDNDKKCWQYIPR